MSTRQHSQRSDPAHHRPVPGGEAMSVAMIASAYSLSSRSRNRSASRRSRPNPPETEKPPPSERWRCRLAQFEAKLEVKHVHELDVLPTGVSANSSGQKRQHVL